MSEYELGRKIFDKLYAEKPSNKLLEEQIEVNVVGNIRCIYLNDHRIAGGKPYISENLPTKTKKLTVQEALAAFSEEQLMAEIMRRHEDKAYFKAYYKVKDILEEQSE